MGWRRARERRWERGGMGGWGWVWGGGDGGGRGGRWWRSRCRCRGVDDDLVSSGSVQEGVGRGRW